MNTHDTEDDLLWQQVIQTLKRMSDHNTHRELPQKPLPTKRMISLKQTDSLCHVSRRLDLHGYTAEQAHRAVLQFVHMAYRMKWRSIEIITGRGNPEIGTGILRREVPLWLETQPLKPYVLQIDSTDSSRGGAFKIMLRRSKY